ncbi:MAG: Lrp/AsnC ligand binding domain-containing protein, partial [Candidatus Njordarchaeales archaeon]
YMTQITAYIMINVEIGRTEEVFRALQNLEGIELVSITAGEFDIIVRISVESLEELFEKTERIHQIEGLVRTLTLVVEKEARREG